MSDIGESLRSLLNDASEFSLNELEQLIHEAKSDSCIFIRHIGELTQEFISMRAKGEIDNDEFKELMEDLIDLDKMQFHKLSVDTKARAEKVIRGVAQLVLNKLLPLIIKSASVFYHQR